MFNNVFLGNSCRLWDKVENIVEPDMPHDNIIWRVRIACWKTKATYTHSKYVICTNCFSAARVVKWRSFKVTLKHTLSVLFIKERTYVFCAVRVEFYIRFGLFLGFYPRLVCVGFVVNLVALREVVLLVLRCLPVSTITPYTFSKLSNILPIHFGKSWRIG
jgi:hypothetical protein